jgi:hypothetical protein
MVAAFVGQQCVRTGVEIEPPDIVRRLFDLDDEPVAVWQQPDVIVRPRRKGQWRYCALRIDPDKSPRKLGTASWQIHKGAVASHVEVPRQGLALHIHARHDLRWSPGHGQTINVERYRHQIRLLGVHEVTCRDIYRPRGAPEDMRPFATGQRGGVDCGIFNDAALAQCRKQHGFSTRQRARKHMSGFAVCERRQASRRAA